MRTNGAADRQRAGPAAIAAAQAPLPVLARTKPKLRLAPYRSRETELHEQVAQLLAIALMPPTEWTTFPAGNIELPPAAGAKLYRLGLKPGWPDFLVLHQHLYGIELKRHGAELSRSRFVRRRRSGGVRWVEGQRDVHPRLERAGMTIAVCHSLDEVIATLQGWGIPLRRGIAA